MTIRSESPRPSAKRRAGGGALVGLLVLLVLFASAVWWFFLRPDVQPHAGVFGANGQELVLRVENERIVMTGDRVEFWPVPRTADVRAEMMEQFPVAVVDDDAVRVIANGSGFVLYPSSEHDGAWVLEAEYVPLSDESRTYDVPFPTRTVTVDDRANWRLESYCDLACLDRFYSAYGGILPMEGGFTVTLANGVIEVRLVDSTYEFRRA